ncbi:rhodanese-like domain-containing protein [Ramlibacter sp.]|uniref:rhodanese-like domain-containing protein n=1 Tax=Ramlibacter sp. TaxID=1917967 RepID=UPI002C40B0AA|nr:rhodanese-like domain-containing protein [Ramlibacter sp.]HWI82347.1 rhodanese-like domain-containing protein [Ramlibacter sp.]
MIDQVRPADLPAWLQAHAGGDAPPIVLDVREPWEVQTASVAPAGFELRHIPMSLVPVRLHELDPARPVACLCHHGGRSQRVALYLAQQGFQQLANVAGGIDAWSREVDPGVPRY